MYLCNVIMTQNIFTNIFCALMEGVETLQTSLLSSVSAIFSNIQVMFSLGTQTKTHVRENHMSSLPYVLPATRAARGAANVL